MSGCSTNQLTARHASPSCLSRSSCFDSHACRYHDPLSIARSCSKAFCRMDELEVFAQPRVLGRVLAHINTVVSLLPAPAPAPAAPPQASSGTPSSGGGVTPIAAADASSAPPPPVVVVAVLEPGMIFNLARTLRALPTVDLELAGVRVMLSDFDVFHVDAAGGAGGSGGAAGGVGGGIGGGLQ